MEGFAPASRRFIAVGLLALALFAAADLIVAPILSWTSRNLSALSDARFRRARLEAELSRPIPPRGDEVPVDAVLHASDLNQAFAEATSYIRDLAARNNLAVVVEQAPRAGSGQPQPFQVLVHAQGGDAHIASFVAAVERGAPFARFSTVDITAPAQPNDQTHLSGTLQMAWLRR